jgi:hypothetical protein
LHWDWGGSEQKGEDAWWGERRKIEEWGERTAGKPTGGPPASRRESRQVTRQVACRRADRHTGWQADRQACRYRININIIINMKREALNPQVSKSTYKAIDKRPCTGTIDIFNRNECKVNRLGMQG